LFFQQNDSNFLNSYRLLFFSDYNIIEVLLRMVKHEITDKI
jgi:hypothetical protein